MRKSGRCFVAVVDIEADRCAVCLAELDVVQSEADRQADVCARRLSGRVGGQATNSLPVAGFLSLLICVSRFAANMGVSRETHLLTKFNKQQEFTPGRRTGNSLIGETLQLAINACQRIFAAEFCRIFLLIISLFGIIKKG